jgi:hypothetical protein
MEGSMILKSVSGSKAQAKTIVAFYYIRIFAQPMSSIAILRSLGPLVFSSMLAACGGSFSESTNPLKWTEEVTLPDGRLLSLTREQHFSSDDLVGRYWFEFSHPETMKTVRWENNGFWKPVALYLEGADVVLLVRAKFDFNSIGCPKPREVAFRFRDGMWSQVPLLSTAIKQLTVNLIDDPKDARAQIIGKSRKLDAAATIEATKIHGAKQSIDFSGVKEQVFHCKQLQKIEIR